MAKRPKGGGGSHVPECSHWKRRLRRLETNGLNQPRVKLGLRRPEVEDRGHEVLQVYLGNVSVRLGFLYLTHLTIIPPPAESPARMTSEGFWTVKRYRYAARQSRMPHGKGN